VTSRMHAEGQSDGSGGAGSGSEAMDCDASVLNSGGEAEKRRREGGVRGGCHGGDEQGTDGREMHSGRRGRTREDDARTGSPEGLTRGARQTRNPHLQSGRAAARLGARSEDCGATVVGIGAPDKALQARRALATYLNTLKAMLNPVDGISETEACLRKVLELSEETDDVSLKQDALLNMSGPPDLPVTCLWGQPRPRRSALGSTRSTLRLGGTLTPVEQYGLSFLGSQAVAQSRTPLTMGAARPRDRVRG